MLDFLSNFKGRLILLEALFFYYLILSHTCLLYTSLQNQIIKSQLKTAIKKFEASLKQGQAAASDAYKVVVKKTDQAVAKGLSLIHI